MQHTTLFADVIIPLSAGDWFTYRIPNHLNKLVSVGQRVLISFGKNKLYAGIVNAIHQTPPKNYEAKCIEDILDDKPIVTEQQLVLWKWIANYYLCTVGEVMAAAVPTGLKLNSETKLVLNPDFLNDKELSDREYLIYEALQIKGTLSIDEVAKILNIKSVKPIINQLLKKKIIFTEEDIKNRYKPRVESYTTLTNFADNEENLKQIFIALARSPKQEEMLTAYLMLSERYTTKPKPVLKSELLKKTNNSAAAYNALEKKEIFKTEKHRVDRTLYTDGKQELLSKLTNEQQEALAQIQNSFLANTPVLLQGVTGSGKTEIYFYLIEEAIKQKKQVLYLLPEIALTYQIIQRLKNHFNDKIGVYHSRFSENERVEIWNRCLNPDDKNAISIVIGARSTLFLPYHNLGLIIVDEEHDYSFKQHDPAPRYHARDMAFVLAKQFKANLILGSATPSLETLYNAQIKKINTVHLTKRYGDLQLPEVVLVDLKEARIKKTIHSLFTKELLEAIKKSLEAKEQIILFQNRRGFARYLECGVCAEVSLCVNCDVSLTYHKSTNNLRCHYCGYTSPVLKTCKKCGSPNLKLQGFGTEKIEEELAVFFPEARLARMDLDTTRNKNSYQQIITEFEEQKTDILIGTQMVTKGLNFERVSLVGVLNADQLLHFPDFRSFEKAYQILTQVAGRSGRKYLRGKIIIQTANPNHEVFKHINHNPQEFVEDQLFERKSHYYPPYSRLIQITVKHKNKEIASQASYFLADKIKQNNQLLVLGPEFPLLERIMDMYQMQTLLKIDRNLSINISRQIIQASILETKLQAAFKGCRIITNVDPF